MTLPPLPTFEDFCVAGDRLVGVRLYDDSIKQHWRVEERTRTGGFLLSIGQRRRSLTADQMREWLGWGGTLSRKTRVPLEGAYERECLIPYRTALHEAKEAERSQKEAERRAEAQRKLQKNIEASA